MSDIDVYRDTKVLPKLCSVFPSGQPVLSTHIIFGERSYYRSKLFNYHAGVNPLAAAASPLFILANQIAEGFEPTTVDPYRLYEQLQHEIKAFENNAQSQQFRSDIILIARYLLCATLDEIILQSVSLSQENRPPSLLMRFHEEADGGERFFTILERLSADPAIHIDLLELVYLCLSAGFCGKYRHLQNGQEILEQLTARLFDCIRFQRGELKKELSITSQPFEKTPVARIYLPLWLIMLFTLVLLLTVYSSFSYMLSQDAQQFYQQISPLLPATSPDTHANR